MLTPDDFRVNETWIAIKMKDGSLQRKALVPSAPLQRWLQHLFEFSKGYLQAELYVSPYVILLICISKKISFSFPESGLLRYFQLALGIS